MKRFTWPLQRLLDVKKKQENVAQMELIALMEQSTAIRGRIMMQKMLLQNLLRDLKNTKPNKRLGQQQEFMQHVHVEDMKIQKLNEELDCVEKQQHKKREQMMNLRKFRKGLERLRIKALSEYHVEMNREEQKLLDDNTHVTFARKCLTAS